MNLSAVSTLFPRRAHNGPLGARISRFQAAVLLLLLGASALVYAQDAGPSAIPSTPRLVTHVMNRSSVPYPSALRGHFDPQASAQPSRVAVNTGPGIVYTCDPSIALATCNYLNTTVAGYYNSTFTNANANIYITYGATGLGQSQGYYNFVTYDQYLTALNNIASKSPILTSALSALNTYDATPYGSDNVEITVALGTALGFTGLTGTTPTLGACTPGDAGCYNEIITVINDPQDYGFSLYYDNLGGTEPANAYDFYAVVEHETDEVLGTSSCISTDGALSDGCGTGNPSAVDLDRYSSAGNLVLDSSLSTTAGAYFSYDGGNTNGANGLAHTPKVYNTLANDNDYADYLSSTPDCGTDEAIQDAQGCPGEDAGLTILNDGGSEINILTAVGFQVPVAVTPPSLTSPTSSPLSGSTKFTWNPGSGSSMFALWIGTSPNTLNVYTSGHVANTVTSETVNIPANGTKLYVSLWYEVGSNWTYKSYTFTEAAPPSLTSPTASPLAGATNFTWNPGTGSTMFALWIGTSPNTHNLYTSGHVANTVTSETVGIPASGATLYVSLWYELNGNWIYKSYTFTEAQPPSLTSPTSSPISGSTNFTWSPGTGSSMFALWIGTSPNTLNVYTSGHVANTVTSETVNIPANGATLYVSLWYEINGNWTYKSYTFTEAP